jgi:hypothetical protein
MIKKIVRLIIYGCLFTILSCKYQTKPFENSFKENIVNNLSYKEVLIKIDSLTLSFEYYTSFDYYEDSGEVLFLGYNHKTHSLDLINLTQRRVSGHIKLESQGPNAVGMRILGINTISADSILIDDESKFFLINSQGLVYWKLIKNDPGILKNLPLGNLLTKDEAFKPGFNKKTNKLIVIYQPVERKIILEMPIIIEIGMDSIETSFIPIYYPEFARANFNSYIPIYGGPQVCFNKEKIIVNFAFESNIYMYDTEKKLSISRGGKSKFTSNQSPAYDKNTNPEEYRLKTINFHPIVYDPFKKLYYRTHWGEMQLKKSEFEYNNWPDKPVFITVFDENLNYLYETKLEIKNGIVPAHLFPTSEGLFVFPWKQNIENLKNDLLKGIILNFK